MTPFGLTAAEARAWAQSLGMAAFRGERIVHGAYRAGVEGFAAIKGLSRQLAERLEALAPLLPGTEVSRQESSDGTVKSLLRLHDGKRVECVSIPTASRHTVCVSTQVGCAVGCSFCASGLNGIERDLSADETRSKLVPINQRWPLAVVLEAMRDYASMVSRRITLEYVLLADANMSEAHAESLARTARCLAAHINLIPFNAVLETAHRAPSRAEVRVFAERVALAGGHVTVRTGRGDDIDAACGQLKRRDAGLTAS